MLRIIISANAESKIDNIYHYTHEKWGFEQAQEYIQLLKNKFLLLAENPHIAIKHNNDESIYRFPIGSHMVYFELQSDCIEFLTILHKNELPLRE